MRRGRLHCHGACSVWAATAGHGQGEPPHAYLFTRSVCDRAGQPARLDGVVREDHQKVNQIAEIRVSLWSPVMSPQINSLTFTSVVDELAASQPPTRS